MRKVIKVVDKGYWRNNGALWPITDEVVRVWDQGCKPEWIVTRGICNGTASSSQVYKTKKEALEAL